MFEDMVVDDLYLGIIHTGCVVMLAADAVLDAVEQTYIEGEVLGQEHLELRAKTCSVQVQGADRITGHSLMILRITCLKVVSNAKLIDLLRFFCTSRVEKVALLQPRSADQLVLRKSKQCNR